MKTIEERADEYIHKMDCSEWTDVGDYARHGYKQGATDEHALLTEWHDPNEHPDNGRQVLLKIRDKLSGKECYTIGNYCDEWRGRNVFFWNELIGWRDIHE